jgi:hypothetical protein
MDHLQARPDAGFSRNILNHLATLCQAGIIIALLKGLRKTRRIACEDDAVFQQRMEISGVGETLPWNGEEQTKKNKVCSRYRVDSVEEAGLVYEMRETTSRVEACFTCRAIGFAARQSRCVSMLT